MKSLVVIGTVLRQPNDNVTLQLTDGMRQLSSMYETIANHARSREYTVALPSLDPTLESALSDDFARKIIDKLREATLVVSILTVRLPPGTIGETGIAIGLGKNVILCTPAGLQLPRIITGPKNVRITQSLNQLITLIK